VLGKIEAVACEWPKAIGGQFSYCWIEIRLRVIGMEFVSDSVNTSWTTQ
jgi:hypothetical protein